jgi:hypothetical protein
MKRLFVLLIILAGVATACAQNPGDSLDMHQAEVRKVAVDEVHVDQEKGRISATTKPSVPAANANKGLPEMGSTTPTPVQTGSSSPDTCDSKNASSPACYAATQQGRGK